MRCLILIRMATAPELLCNGSAMTPRCLQSGNGIVQATDQCRNGHPAAYIPCSSRIKEWATLHEKMVELFAQWLTAIGITVQAVHL